MKFDYAVVNPPYDRNLHLKVLEQVLKVADKVINISPVRWLQDPFAPYINKSDYNKFEKSVSKHIKNIQFIPAKEATQLFGDASFTMNLGIYELDANGGWNYQHNDPLVTKIVEKTMENSWVPFNFTNQKNKKQYKFVLKTNDISEWLVNTTYENQLTVKGANPNWKPGGQTSKYCIFSFNTEDERKNFYECYNTPFMKWHTTLWKADKHIYPNKVPYFGDYTHKWKLRDFFDWFDLTPAERTRVVKEIRDMRHAKFQNKNLQNFCL